MARRSASDPEPASACLRPAAIVLALALALRILYVLLLADTGCLAINRDPVSDMETFHRWAFRIVEGDWLGREEFHPYHPWQRSIAPEQTWLDWYGRRVFHQDPLYAYTVALVYLIAPREPSSVIALQILLGALTAAGICVLAGLLAGRRAALAAGLLAALYGPLLFYESLLLRDTLLVSLTTAFLISMEAARQRSSRWLWALTGVLAGAVYLTKPNIAAFLPLLAGWMILGSGLRHRWRMIGALAVGFALSLSPVIARNIAVGAPVWKTTTRGAIEFINGNNPYHHGIGWFDGDDERVATYARETLHRTRARLAPTVAAVVSTWRGRIGDLVALQIKKLGYLLAPFEMPNNASYSYFRLNSPVLRIGLPTFYVVSPLAALGLLLTARQWRRLLPYYLFLLVGIAVTVAFYVIARFRIPLLPLLLVFAGAGAAGVVELTARRRWLPLAGSGLFIAAILVVNTANTYPDTDLVRPQDYLVAAGAYASRGEVDRAARELDRGREVFPGFVPLHLSAARLKEDVGDPAGALDAYEEALKLEPGSRPLQDAVRRLRASLGRSP
jgi:4-amino-4-deoxy-L-arabinose transferase-like glycosyltransferase